MATTTAAAVLTSLAITATVYYLVKGSFDDIVLGLIIAVLAPVLIAPAASYRYISLSSRLHRANERLRVLSELDSLTSTLNRRTFMEVARKQLALACRYGYPTSLILLDFDNFKQVNDEYGHATGDKVLVNTVEAIRGAIRDTDVIARIGGEEFVLLLPHTAREGTVDLTERILDTVRRNQIATGAADVNVTVSMGGSICERSTTNLDELMSSADKLLYQAKQEGRNRARIGPVLNSVPTELSKAS